MAPGYGQYNNYYDPVGNQANQNQGYAYPNQSAATSSSQPTTAAYTTPQYPGYGAASYNSIQQYGSGRGGQQNDARRNSGATSSAIGARGSGANGHDTQASANRSNTTQQQETEAGSWGNPNYSASYSTSLQPPSGTSNNTSPQCASAAPASISGRLSYAAPSQQAQSGSSTYNQQSYDHESAATQNYANSGTSDTSRQTYSATQHHQTSTEPSRYASPLHAVQAQQHQQQQQQQSRACHSKQPSRSSNQHTSPSATRAPLHLNDHRRSSASAEPANTTVDPSQVYDFRAEREKKAKAEAEKRRKMEEIEAAKKAEEARIAEEKRMTDEAVWQAEEAKRQAEETRRQAEEMRINEERRRAEQAKRKADENTAAVKAAVKAEAKRKKEEQRRARESKNAASTLASLATRSNVQEPISAPPPANDEEAEMRAMFQKMREFNSKNPSMLAKLWEEERRIHAAQSQSPQPSVAAQPAAPAPEPSAPKIPSSTPLSASTATPAQMNAPRSANNTMPTSATTAATGSTMRTPAPAASATQGNAPQANTHLWPPGKKGLLAEIAARWLHSVNPHRVVTTSEILERLDLNPNYVQLCESLEAMGLRFERAAFARELLRGIPPAGPTNQTSPKVTEATIMSANGTVAEAAAVVAPAVNNLKPKRPRATKAEMEQRRSLSLVKRKGKATQSSNSGMVDYEMPSFSMPEDAAPSEYVTHMPEQTATSSAQQFGMSPQFSVSDDYSRQPSLSVQLERRSVSGVQQGVPTPVGSAQPAREVRPPSPARPPADKEEAARKRGFGDLVDLTADDSDDGDLPPVKMMKASQGPRHGDYQQQHAQRPQQPHQSKQQYNQQQMNQIGPFDKFRMPSSAVPSPRNVGSPLLAPGAPATPTLYMQPDGSFGKAPTAVMSAATGSIAGPANPTVNKPPIAPTPAPQPIKRKGPTNERLQQERIRGRMVVEPIMRDRVARRSTYDSRTIARDILLATGRHPDMRPLNSHLNAMQKLLGDRGGMLDQSGNKSDLATIKWDILDPDPPRKPGLPKKSQFDDRNAAESNNVKRSTEVAGKDADDEEEEVASRPEVAREGEGSVRGEFALRANAKVDANMNNKPLKKRGRPPRSSAPTADAFPSVNSAMEPTPRAVSGTPRQVSTQPQSTPIGTPVGYAAFRKYDQDGKEIKKKGRPVGWRKSIHSREAQGLSPKKSLSAKPKLSTPRPEAPLQEPKYQVYKCHWLDCDAQLHSLEVLKKHVTRVHGQSDTEGEYRCRWRGCKLNTEASTPFKEISAWLGHIDKEHLQAVAWRLGDGPRGGLSGE
jgi:hypothetical protein